MYHPTCSNVKRKEKIWNRPLVCLKYAWHHRTRFWMSRRKSCPRFVELLPKHFWNVQDYTRIPISDHHLPTPHTTIPPYYDHKILIPVSCSCMWYFLFLKEAILVPRPVVFRPQGGFFERILLYLMQHLRGYVGILQVKDASTDKKKHCLLTRYTCDLFWTK